MSNPTTVKHVEDLWFGSAKFEVGSGLTETGSGTEDTLLGGIDLGAMKNISFKENWDKVEIKSDNAGVLRRRIRNQTFTLEGELQEFDLSVFNTLRGGLDTYSTDGSGNMKLESGGLFDIDAKVVRITNYDDNGKKLSFTVKKAYNAEGIACTLQPFDADKENTIKISFEGVLDPTLTAGKQLFSLYQDKRWTA